MAQVKNPRINDVLRFITHDDLLEYKKKNSSAALNQQVAYFNQLQSECSKKGVIFVSPSKEDLSEGRGYIMTSYETLFNQHDSLSHWTPNTFWGGTYYDFKNRVIKGHTKDNLKQINCICFDIDTKDIDPYEIFVTALVEDLPRPNLVLETTKGYQGCFVFSTPFYISKKNTDNALNTAERLANNILSALSKHLPIDRNCNSFGFFRMPKIDNIVYFDDAAASTDELINWSKQYEKEAKRKTFRVLNGGFNAQALNYTTQEWYSTLLNVTEIESGYFASSRNNALMTLALAAYASGKSYEEAYDELDQFNTNLQNPLKLSEFNRTLKSAFSGKYAGPKRDYVEGLLELWTDAKSSFKGKRVWYKFKKERSERVRSHYDEREEDILKALENKISPENPFLEGSLSNLAEQFGMAVSTLKEVLKRSKKLVKIVEGKGRAAVSKITTRVILLRHLLRIAKTSELEKKIEYRNLLKSINKQQDKDNVTIAVELLFNDSINLSRASPTVNMKLLI